MKDVQAAQAKMEHFKTLWIISYLILVLGRAIPAAFLAVVAWLVSDQKFLSWFFWFASACLFFETIRFFVRDLLKKSEDSSEDVSR